MELNKDNYFSREADAEYMSVSQFKNFEECPAMAMAIINGEYEKEKTVSLLVGSYVDAYFGGELEKFKAENPEVFNSRTGELKAEYKQAEKIIERVKKDKLWMEYATGGKEQVIMTGEIAGIKIKIMIDNLHSDKIVDRKIVKDFEPMYKEGQGRLSWFEFWRYDLQGGVYREIVRQNTGKTLPFFLAPATKEKITNFDVLHISDTALDFELEEFTKKVPLYDAIKKGIIHAERCGKCDYCKLTKTLTTPTESEDYEDE
jgi:hypothetical protein